MNARRIALLNAFLAFALGGCQSAKPIYFWGQYETLVYQTYTNPSKAPPELQVQKLQEDVHRAASQNLPPPPGLHAHLGYLFNEMGQFDKARMEFETEKSLFPESAVFMDRLLSQLEGKKHS